jgi:GT2 family glycosyltransferase
MVGEYHRLLPLQTGSSEPVPASRPLEPSEAVEAMTLASMWKQLRATHVQLNVAVDARHRSEQGRVSERRSFEEQVRALRGELHDARSLLAEKGMRLQEKERQLQDEEAKLNELMASTSWRLTRPVRALGTAIPALRKAWRRLRYGSAAAAAVTLPGDPEETLSATWRRYRETLEREVRPRLVERVDRLPRRPLLTVVVPTYNTPEPLLRQMIDSVRAQIYPEWELCVADDGSTAEHVRRVLDEYAAADPRIRVSYAEANGGVSRASNRALAMARGEFVTLLDHDDLYEEQALLRVAESLLADDPDMLYSDEALVGPDGQEVQRYFLRPAFSLEHLHSHPYIVHLVAFRTSLLREVGGWNESLLISQDYDLIVRVAERARKIVHVPEILYRWRNHGTSAGHARQGQVVEASLGLLRQHLERTGVPGRVEEGASFNFYSVRYALGEGLRVGIVIPTKNHGDLLRQCIDSLRATIGKVAYDILVVDHESDDPGTLDYLASLSGQARVVRFSGPFNFAVINNFAVKQLGAGYSHYLLCNNDIEAYEHGWLERMVELAQQPDAGIVGAMLFYPDRKTIQHAGVCIGMSRGAEHYGKFLRYPEDTSGLSRELLSMTREVAAVTAACMLVRRDAWEEVGGFDEKIAVGYGDVDLCLRVVDSGRRVLFCASARLIHHESFTRGTSEFDPHPVDTSAFREKWKRLLEAGDPYYSPAFSLNSRRWEIRRPLPCQVEVRRRVVERDPEGRRNRIAFSPSI